MLLVALGTRGDVEPAVRLGTGLARLGAGVDVAVLADGADVVERAGLSVTVVGPASAEAMWWRSAPARELALRHPGAMYLQTRTRLAFHADDIAAALADRLAGADLVLCGLAAAALVPVLQRAGVPARLMLHAPLLPHPGGTSAWNTVAAAGLVPRRFEAHRQAAMWGLTRGLSSSLARTLGRRLGSTGGPPVGQRRTRRPLPAAAPLLSTSPVLDPEPSPGLVQTGWWADPSPVRPLPPEVAAWLARNPDPVLLSLGSLTHQDPEDQVARLVEVAGLAGAAALIQVHDARPGPRQVRPRTDGPGGRATVEVLVVGEVDHRVLLPRVRAVIHHGGSGTTHAVAAAGRPQLVVPKLGDQPHYGRQVHRVGLGPPAVPHSRASPAAMSQSLTDLLRDPAHARAATAAAGQMAQEDGLGRAVGEVALAMDLQAGRSGAPG